MDVECKKLQKQEKIISNEKKNTSMKQEIESDRESVNSKRNGSARKKKQIMLRIKSYRIYLKQENQTLTSITKTFNFSPY